MKTVMTLIIAMMASQMAGAAEIATGSVWDPVTRIFSSCDNCKAMQNLRGQYFIPAQRDARKRPQATAKIQDVTAHAERLMNVADNDSVSLRNAHYADEITTFYYLAADALPYAEDLDIAANIAYLNSVLGSRNLFEKVLNDEVLKQPENSCRKDFFKQAVESKECELANDNETELATSQKRAPKLQRCRTVTMSVSDCEAAKIRARDLKKVGQ